MDVLMQLLCTALTVTYASNPYTVLLLPKGNCQMCCPYHKDDIKLYVNIPGGPVEQYLDWENGSDWRQLNNNRTTVIYIHGFTEQHTGPAAEAVRTAYRERGEDNLVVVDWSSLAAAPWYPSAVVNTQHAATFLAGVIDSLVIRGLPLDKIHVIGFSLGAEIAGLLAKKLTVGKLKRITGLDPALPLYDPVNPRGRLAKTDAEFVDVIHTDGGIFGFDLPLGHADFFPNGGKPAQPGCKVETLINTGRLNEFVACSHNRAWMYYAESVRDPLAFPSFKCHTFLEFEKGKCKPNGPPAYMGYLADPSLRGKYFLDTQSTKPFGRGLHQDSVSVSYHINLAPNTASPGIGGESPVTPATAYQQPAGSLPIGSLDQEPPPTYPPVQVYSQDIGQPLTFQQQLYRAAINNRVTGKGGKETGLSDQDKGKELRPFLNYGTTGTGTGVRNSPEPEDYLYPDYPTETAVYSPFGAYYSHPTTSLLDFPYATQGELEYDSGLYAEYQPEYQSRPGRAAKSKLQQIQKARRKKIQALLRKRGL